MAEIGILFDIDELEGGFYGMAAWKILLRNLDPDRLSACLLYDGDTAETLAGEARQYVIVVQAFDDAQIEYVREAMNRCDDKGLLPGGSRFLLGEVTSRHPLVQSARIDAVGNLVVGQGQMIGDDWVEGTPWKVVRR